MKKSLKKQLALMSVFALLVSLWIPSFAAVHDWSFAVSDQIRIRTKVVYEGTLSTTETDEILTVPFDMTGAGTHEWDEHPTQEYTFVDTVTATGLAKKRSGFPKFPYTLETRVHLLFKDASGNFELVTEGSRLVDTRIVYGDAEGNMVDANGNKEIKVGFTAPFRKNAYYAVTQHLKSHARFNGSFHEGRHNLNFNEKDQTILIKDPQDPKFKRPQIPNAGDPSGGNPNGGVTQNFPPGDQYVPKPRSVITSVVSNGGAFRSDKNTPISFEINDHSDPSITVTDTITASGLVPNQEYRVTAEIYEVPAMAMLSIREVLKEHFYPGSPVATKVVTLIADSSGNIPATKIIFDSRYYSGKQSVNHPSLQTTQYLDFRHYLVTQTLESVNKFDFGSGLETHRVEHTNKDNMLQVFVVKDTRFYSDPTPPPQPPQLDVINKPSDSKIVTVVSSGEDSASSSAALVLKAEQGKKKGDMVWVSVTDHVEAKNFLDMDTLYKITTRVMKKNTDGSVTEVKKIDSVEPSRYTTGSAPISGRKNFDVEVDISGKYVVGEEYVVYQEMSVQLESGFIFDDNTREHKVEHNNPQNLSQSFRIVETPAPPVNTNPQPQPSTDPQPQPSGGNSNQPEPQPTPPSSESVVTSSPSVAETSAETTTTTEVVPVQTAEGTTTTAVTTETATTETVTTTAVAVITTTESVTTRTTAEIPTTERIFEFIDIFEDIPLAVRTTAPLDLEEILIEESVPLGGLPYTGNFMTELYIGFGLFIASIGVLLKKRM